MLIKSAALILLFVLLFIIDLRYFFPIAVAILLLLNSLKKKAGKEA